jgi:branched-chain amino acid transport system ATP-binding protein
MLRVEGVQAGYRNVGVLHDVDLVVPDGSVVALLGANGAGKTTLLRVVAGILSHRRGHLSWNGKAIDALAPHQRSRLGLCLVPEGRAIFRQLTVRDNFAMYTGGRLGDSLERAVATFPVLGRRLDQQAGTLSGGEQQMLALARALVTSPQLVMADELSVGLAPIVVDEIFVAIDQLRRTGASLLMVEQYVDRVLDIADYVYVLHKGRIVLVSEPATCQADELFARYLGSAVQSGHRQHDPVVTAGRAAGRRLRRGSQAS